MKVTSMNPVKGWEVSSPRAKNSAFFSPISTEYVVVTACREQTDDWSRRILHLGVAIYAGPNECRPNFCQLVGYFAWGAANCLCLRRRGLRRTAANKTGNGL